jgi:hypothetical protein
MCRSMMARGSNVMGGLHNDEGNIYISTDGFHDRWWQGNNNACGHHDGSGIAMTRVGLTDSIVGLSFFNMLT